jgi:hypothetical protein
LLLPRSWVTLTSALTSAPEGSRVPMGARRAVPAAKASGRYRFGEGTFPRIPGNDGEAPIADIPYLTLERGESTHSSRSFPAGTGAITRLLRRWVREFQQVSCFSILRAVINRYIVFVNFPNCRSGENYGPSRCFCKVNGPELTINLCDHLNASIDARIFLGIPR